MSGASGIEAIHDDELTDEALDWAGGAKACPGPWSAGTCDPGST